MIALIVTGSIVSYLLGAAVMYGWLHERRGVGYADAGACAALWPFCLAFLPCIYLCKGVARAGTLMLKPRPKRTELPTAKVRR